MSAQNIFEIPVFMKKICCIGHITLDKIVTPQTTVYMPGGTSYYFAHGMCSLNPDANFELVTALAESEMSAVEAIRKRGAKVTVLPSRYSVYFENSYGENQDNRTQRVLAKADPFEAEKLQDIEADIFHLGSLLADDFDIEVFRLLSKKGILSVDAQGYLREVRGEKVYAIDWKNKRDYLQYVDILKVNEFEIESLTGYSDVEKAALQLCDWGVKEVLITLGSYGSVIYKDNTFYNIPAYLPKSIVDATGCGDTYVTGYLYKRSLGASIEDSGCFAAAMSSFKLEKSGPFNGTEQDVEALIARSGLKPEIVRR